MPKANTTIAGHKAAEMRTSGNWCAPMRATETITIIIPRATPGSWHQMDACLRAPSLPQQPAALLRHGWLAPVAQISSQYGDPAIWPGDTFGISVLPGRHGAGAPEHVALSWGSTVGGSKNSEIYATVAGR